MNFCNILIKVPLSDAVANNVPSLLTDIHAIFEVCALTILIFSNFW